MNTDNTASQTLILRLEDYSVSAGAGHRLFETPPVSATIHAGSGLFWFGRIGTGKSLIAQGLANLLPPFARTSGTMKPTAPSVALVPQDPRLVVLPSDTLASLGRVTRAGTPSSPSLLETLAELHVDAERLRHVPFRDCSTSERTRILLALALESDPDLVVIDGWAEGASPFEAGKVLELIERRRQLGTAFLIFGREAPVDLPVAFEVRELPGRPTSHAVPLIRRAQRDEAPEPKRPNLLELRNVRVARGRSGGNGAERGYEAVRGVSFYLREGGSLALLGPAGSGKSALLEAIFGVSSHRSGRILFGGHDIPPALASAPRFRKEMQLALKDGAAALDGQKTVRQLLSDAYKIAGQKPYDLGTWVSRLGLPDRILDLPADHLSAGESARIALARSLIPRPRLLLLDAPRTLGLTTDDGALLSVLLGERQRGMSLLVATSDPSIAVSLCDHVAMMFAGVAVEIGPAARVLEAPAHPATLDYLEGSSRPIPQNAWVPGCAYTAACRSRELGRCDAVRPRLEALLLPETGERRRIACHFPLRGTAPESPAT